jgi:drug/metabolite transporter (DMT)-like permease
MIWMIKRHILLTTYGFVFAQCFFYLPINLVHTISSSGPVFVLIIDYFLYNIEISKKQLIGVLISSIGMLLAVNG